MIPFVSNCQEKMTSVCLVGSWAKVSNGNDDLEMAENVFINRNNIKSLPEEREYLRDFREKHPDVKAALVDGIDLFDDQYFAVGESEAICMDPQQRMIMQGVIHALENAGISVEMAARDKIAVYTAAWAYDYKDLLPPDQYMATGNSASVMCGRITYFLNSRGAAVGIETACSSSLVAFHLARKAIISGETKVALVCGANHIGSRSFHSLYNSHMVSPNGRLAAFDRSANGFVRAESFAVAILCSKQYALDNNLNIECECIGSSFNSDGRTPSLTAPSPVAQTEVQLEAIGKIDRHSIQMVTCHGTGTKLGDQIELAAIKNSFKPDVRVMSPKSSLGHGEGAAGLIGVLQSLYSMKHNIIPNQLNLQLPSEELSDMTSMVFVNEENDLNRVAISSYGFGGTNSCAIIQKAEKQKPQESSYSEANVLFLSAKSMESLKLKISDYSFYLQQTNELMNDILYTENTRKTKYNVRAAVFGKSKEELAQKLEDNDIIFASNCNNASFIVEFGEGNEKLWLLRMLYERNETFRSSVDKYCKLAADCGFVEARTALFYPFKLTLTPLAYNISRLISSMATFDLLIEYQTLPEKIVGRGLGQVFSLACSQVISFNDAVNIIKTVVAEHNLDIVLNSIVLKDSITPIQYGNHISKSPKTEDIIDEIRKTPIPNLMSFNVNDIEIIENDPVRKVEKLMCHLFVSGYDINLKFRGKIVRTPGYSFLKRRFWPEVKELKRSEPLDAKTKISEQKNVSATDNIDVEGIIKSIVKKFTDIDDENCGLLESGSIDSLTSIEMVEAIGSAFKMQMPFDLLDTYPTTKNIVEFVSEKLPSSLVKALEPEVTDEPHNSKNNGLINIIAADFMFAGVNGERELWDALMTSRIVTGKISDQRRRQCGGDSGLTVGLLPQDISLFDNSFFSLPKDEALFIDPQHRLLMHAAYNALEKTGMTAIQDADLFVAISSHSEYRAIAEKYVTELDERLWMGTVHSMVAGRIATLLGVRGRAVLVDTTCSSVASALEMALNSIKQGRKYAIVATTQLIQSSRWTGSLKNLLDHFTTKSYSVDGEGFCRSDGVGVIILKAHEAGDSSLLQLSDAMTHHSGTVVTPVVSALSQLLDNVGKVKYIEGHGTATLAGDSAESIAYQKLGQEVVMSSVKAQFGHCEVASGLIQLLKVGAITRNGFIPAIVHNVLPNSHIRNCDNIRLPFVAEENDIEKAAIVSFGVTGTKSVVTTLKSRIEDNNLTPLSFILPMSAKTKDGINKMIHNFIEMLENSNESLYDISLAMQKQKTQFKWRSAVVGNNHTEVVKKLQRIVENGNRHVKNWCFSSTATNYISFFESIPEFEEKYTSFCQRLRFEPLSNPFSIYHFMAISYAFISIVLKHDITKKFAVSGMDSLILLAAIDAAPNHYLNDLMHSFASNDPRQMKRIARDVTVQIDSIEIVNLSGSPIKTARNAVDAALDVEIPNGVVIEENVLVLTGNEMFPNTKIIKSCSDYFEIIAEKYVKGDSIDFEEIFGQSRRFIELPEYPFNRKPFWLPYTMDTHNSKIETTNDISFSINDNKWKHVRNHVVDSQIVVPGATSIRIVYETLSNMVVTLYNIDFLNKIVPKDQSMTIKKEDDEANGMSTLLYDNLEAICCKAKPEEKDFKPLEMLLGTSCHQYDNEDIYHRFSLSQLIYRDGFQMIECIQYLNGNGMCQYVEIHDLDILIDGALQSIVVCYMFENPEDHSPFMPFTIDKIFISTDSLVGKKLKGYINYKYSDLFVTGSSTVYDDIGNVIIHIENVSFKRLHSVAPSSVSRAVTAARLRKGNSNEEARRSASQMLHEWFNDTFGWTDLDDTVGFFDLGLSSIQAVKLRNSIKSHYPDASSTCVFDYPTIEELSSYLSTLVNPEDKTLKKDLEEDDEEEEHQPPTRIAESPVGVMAAACRLPGGVRSPAELWQLLKIGKNASSRIPATRIPSRNVLISGSKYGTPVEGGNFIQDDISMFDPSFFKISKSEAEMIDPQQRILLECVQECLENSGVTETSDVGVFIGLMEKEYQDMIESTSILSMLGSMAAVIAGRINYVFGCNGPSVTIDTACSSSLVALEMAVNALLDKRCSRVLVAGVNLILNEKGQGLRTNGKMLSNHGMSLSFDSRASGYGRSDGCVVLMLEIAKPNYHYMSTIQAVNVNHGGHSVSLTAPNGVAHKMLLTNVINASPSLDINYWEAHGTGTPLGDPIEFNTLSSILQNILIGSVKASLGHGEASAGTCGLLKLFLMLTYQYVPTLIHFHVINKDINTGTIRLPVIGEENELNSAGISSFGVSGTNAAAICFNDNSKLVPYAAVHKKYILPLSAKNQTSLQRLEEDVMSIIAQTDVPISTIASSLANSRSHYSLRSAFIVSNTGITIGKTNGKLNKLQNKNKYLIRLTENLFDPSLLQFYTVDEFYTMAMLKYPQAFSLKYSVINFIKSISNYIQIVPMDNYELISCLLKDGLLDWKMFRAEMIELPTGSLLNELLSDFNLGPSNCNYISLLQDNINVNVNRTVNSLHDVMELITDMYINGYNIDWSSIYSPPQTYINLPNYYFNKQSLWFKEQDEVFDHYLVGSIEKEDEEQLVFMNLLSELRHPQLFRGKPVDVGTILEIAIEAAKVRTDIPFSLQNVNTHQIVLTKPVWLKTFISSEESGLRVTGMIDEQELFSVSITPFESDNVELPCMDVRIPEKVVFLQDCPNAIIRRNHNTFHVDSTAEVSPFRTANIVLNEIIGFTPNPSDMYLEILGPMVDAYYLVRVDDGALWQFQLISHDKKVLSNMYVLKDAKGLEVPMTRMHKKSTLLSSQEASNVAMKTLQMEIRTRLKKAFNDVIDSGLEIDESQLSTGFTELGLDSLATVDLLNRINQKYFTEIEITTGDLFDNPNIIDLSIRIEELLSEKNISNLPPSTTPTPKISMRKISIPAVKHQEMAQIEFVKQYDNQNIEANEQTDKLDKNEVKRKISTAVLDIATETVNADELETKGFNELGMDSLSVVDFINRLNEKYFPGEDIKTSDVFDYPTVNELTEHIIRKRSMHNDSNENGKDFHEVSNHDENSSEQIKSNILNDAYFLTIENSLEFKTDVTMSIDDDKKIILTKMNVNKIISPDDQTEIHSILNGTNLMIEINNFDGSIEELYGILLTFAKSLSKKSTKLNIAVSPTECLPHSVARAFFKTIASEKYPNIKYHWDQRVQQIRANESVKSIDGTWLITGGLSGVGYEIGRFIANNGADAVLLMSRRSPTNEILQDTAKWNSKVYTIACDVTDHDKLIREIERLNVRITGVVHSAGILKDAKLERQTMESFKQVFSPKADGFKSLEAIEEHFNYTFDHFIVMSSFTSACGNEGQLNYAVSNAFLEYQIQRRRNSGKSGCAIQWGNWIDTGMATNAQVRKFLANLGFLGQTNEVALKYLKMCIETRPKVIMVASLDWNKILNNRKDLPRDLVKINIVDMNNVANLDYSKKLTRNVKKCNDYSSKIGLNIFFNDNESLPKIKEEAIDAIKNGKSLRTSGSYCVTVTGSSIKELITRISNATQTKECGENKMKKSVLMLTGQGSQYPLMGRQLCENYAIFKETLQFCLKSCDKYLQSDIPLWNILFDTENYKELQLTKHMQPIMFSFGYSLAKLWSHFGFQPDYLLGHSVGELAAAVLAGILSLDDGLKLIVERGKAMEKISGLGALLAVKREIADDVQKNFNVSIATLNSPQQVVFAGTKQELDRALEYVKKNGKQGTFVNQRYPFHSNLIQESHLADLRQCLKKIQFKKAHIPVISNVTGKIIEVYDEEYVIKHTISAVNFVSCVENLQQLGVNTWVDAGPAAVLATFVKRIIPTSELVHHRILQTCKEKDSDIDTLLQSCLELEQAGVSINWNSFYGCDTIAEPKLVDFPKTMIFKITEEEYEYLKDHKLNGEIIIAGVYQITKLKEFLENSGNAHDVVLRNVKFTRPWYDKDGHEFKIQWKSDNIIELRVNGNLMCTAIVSNRDENEIEKIIPTDEVEFDVARFYKTLYKNGLQYEDRFRVILNAKRSNKRCFANMKTSQFLWPIIDGAMHSITASVIERRPDSYFLPVSFGYVHIDDYNTENSRMRATTTIISETDKFIQVNVGLYDSDKIVCEIRNMTIVVVKREEKDEAIKSQVVESEQSEIQIAFNYIRKSYVNSMEVMSNSVEQRVLTDVSEILNKPVKLNESFTMAGGNSLKAIQLEERINEDFGSQIKAHDILQADSIQQLSSLISRSIKKPLSKMSKVITNLRDVPGAKLSIYLIHAIGGTIYPYYSFLQIFPKNIALYGIEYDLSYPSENLKTLTSFYANEIAAHAKTEQIFVMGHSMGGIMSREIVNELRIWGYNIPFVILFDSWVLRANELDVENIRSFLMYVFSGLPDSERRLDRAIKLAHLLREYRTPVSDTKLILFKSKRLGDAAFKSAVRTDLNEELSRSMLFNGFDELSTQAIDTHIIDGDHESCLKVENLKKVKEQIIAPFKPYI